MPIYAYRCADCGHAQDFLQKMSDAPIDVCPSCGSRNFVKQVTAAGFQLKGGGWYVTDFRDSGKKEAKKPADGADAKTADANAGAEAKSAAKGAEAGAATPAASPAAAPASTSASSPSTGGDTKAA
ncbi:MAG: zinc ribbon domain-containing protein [Burkholderiales bacterium]|nr:zinc ribbon domain-containing protein [Burkholderiales bacterium]